VVKVQSLGDATLTFTTAKDSSGCDNVALEGRHLEGEEVPHPRVCRAQIKAFAHEVIVIGLLLVERSRPLPLIVDTLIESAIRRADHHPLEPVTIYSDGRGRLGRTAGGGRRHGSKWHQ
jgi:hypothetical protein